jgi:hypothetical protein
VNDNERETLDLFNGLFLTSEQASQRLHIEQSTLRAWQREGKLHSIIVAGRDAVWPVSEIEVIERYFETEGFPKVGRPRNADRLPKKGRKRR